MIIPGRAISVVIMKNVSHPVVLTIAPEVEANKSLAKDINEESKAYCVAVYAALHKEEI